MEHTERTLWIIKDFASLRCAAWAADRRGVTALAFAVVAAVLLGVAGLATEVGSWYLARSLAFNTADAVAVAGALETALQTSDPSAYNASYDPASDAQLLDPVSGYASASVTASGVAWTDSQSTDAPATQATVQIPFPSIIASLFTTQAVAIGAEAVALVRPTGSVACVLSVNGPLSVTQGQSSFHQTGYPCYYGANYLGPDAIYLNPPDVPWAVDVQGITTEGTCDPQTCPTNDSASPLTGGTNVDGNVFMARPIATYQPPTTNPYTAVDAGVSVPASQIICPIGLSYPPGTATYPPNAPNNANCPQAPGTPVTITSLVPSGGDWATNTPSPNQNPTCPQPPTLPPPTAQPSLNGFYCGYYNMNVTINSDIAVAPGTYLFVNSSLTIQSGTIYCVAYSNADPTLCDPYDPPEPQAAPSDFSLGQQGVTFVFTGSPSETPASLIICGSASTHYCPGGVGASVLLSAPQTSGFSSPALDGILFYRAAQNPPPGSPDGSSDAPVVYIDDNGNTLLEGGMYFPNAYISFTANTGPTPGCAILVAGVVNLGLPPTWGVASAGSSQFVGASCAASVNTPLPLVQTVQVVK